MSVRICRRGNRCRSEHSVAVCAAAENLLLLLLVDYNNQVAVFQHCLVSLLQVKVAAVCNGCAKLLVASCGDCRRCLLLLEAVNLVRLVVECRQVVLLLEVMVLLLKCHLLLLLLLLVELAGAARRVRREPNWHLVWLLAAVCHSVDRLLKLVLLLQAVRVLLLLLLEVLLLQEGRRCCRRRLLRLLLLSVCLAAANAVRRRLVCNVIMHPMKSHLVFDFFALLFGHAAKLDGVARHSKRHALLQPTVLAPVPVDPVDDAVLLPGTLVVDYGRLAAPEEALAALAGDHAIVDAGRLVAAHLARYDLNLS